MRHYYIYLIEDEVAKEYYGREDKLFALFNDAKKSEIALQKKQLDRQIQYVTKLIPLFYFNKKVYEEMKTAKSYKLKGTKHVLKSEKQKSNAELQITPHVITLNASGSYEAETVFFETLRHIHPYFLAIDFENMRYGWLKPIKNAHLI